MAPPFEAADQLRQAMPPEQKRWLEDVDAMQAAFRWDDTSQKICAASMLACLLLPETPSTRFEPTAPLPHRKATEVLHCSAAVQQAANAPAPLLPAWCRHDALAKLCMERVKQEFASLFSGYSSNSTVRGGRQRFACRVWAPHLGHNPSYPAVAAGCEQQESCLLPHLLQSKPCPPGCASSCAQLDIVRGMVADAASSNVSASNAVAAADGGP